MALVGDNGAGKSTLVKCIAGHARRRQRPDLLRGPARSHIHGPKDAARLGIEVVYQDLALCDNLDVVQNMYLGREVNRFQILNEATMEQHTAETLKSLAVTTITSVRQPVATLSGGQRQSVAVARAVHVELEARHPRRADRGARRRADRAGARARAPARRAGPRRHPDLAQPPRRLRDRRPDHRPAARHGASACSSAARRRSRRSSRRSPPAPRRRSPASPTAQQTHDERRRRRPGPRARRRSRRSELPGGLAGLWARAWLNLRTGNLGPVPIIVGDRRRRS